jgi:hypothetical protein
MAGARRRRVGETATHEDQRTQSPRHRTTRLLRGQSGVLQRWVVERRRRAPQPSEPRLPRFASRPLCGTTLRHVNDAPRNPLNRGASLFTAPASLRLVAPHPSLFRQGFQSGLGLALAQHAKCGQLLRLLLPRHVLALFPVVDRLATGSGQPSKLSGRQSQLHAQ